MTLQLNQPALLGDTANSGGPMIRDEIIPGVEGNLLPKVSRGDRVDGAVAIRELFVAFETADNTVLEDAGVVVSEPPAADGVSVVLFEVPGREWAYRSEAVDYVEAYTQAGQEMDWRIFGSHLTGFKTLRLWGLPTSPLPSIGDSLFLTNEEVGSEFEQPFRIEGLTVVDAIYSAGSGDIPHRDLLLELSAPMEQDIEGDSAPGFTLPFNDRKVRKGQVTDNAKFYGVAALTADVGATDTEIRVDSVFAAIVPASQSSTAIVDVPALPLVARRVTSGAGQEYTAQAGPAHTDSELITGGNRLNTYSASLNPLPAKGTYEFKYVVLGHWITLRDNGDGTFGGPGQGGSGTVSDVTGTRIANLDNPPDLDTYIVESWGTHQQFARLDGQTFLAAAIDQALTPGIEPGTLTATWKEGGASKSLADDGNGNLTGDAAGKVYYGNGRVVARTAALPDGDIDWSVNDGASAVDQDVFGSVAVSGGRVQFTVATALPITPGSATVWMEVNHRFPDGLDVWGQFTTSWLDDGAGVMVSHYSSQHGTINYATGEYDLPEVMPNHTTALRWTATGYVAQVVSTHFAGVGPVRVVHSGTGGANAIAGTLSGYPVRLTLDTVDAIVPGALIFTLGGDTYRGADNGTLARDAVVGGVAGSVAADGAITVTDWIAGGANTPALSAALSRGEDWTLTSMHWATPGFPIQAGSLSLIGTAAAGGQKNAGTDGAGAYTGDATGTADFQTGFSETTWNEDMDPASITHSGVILTLIPLDKDIIGIDSARLPSDGQVPIFHSGGRLAVGAQLDQTLPDPLSAGQVVSLNHAQLNTLCLVDQDDLSVDTALYTVDRDVGSLTMADPLDLAAYNEPLVATLHWDDYAKVIDAQANGIITLQDPLGRAYVTGDRVYSMLRMGDLQAHAPLFFDQKTWSGQFSDSLVGDPAAGTYNFAAFPVELDNDSAPTERWALHFVNSTTVEVIGETMGNLGQFAIAADIAPTDPANGKTVFTLRSAGWGGGWIPGNVLRINVQAAASHAFALRVVGGGAEDIGSDQAVLQPRGDQ